MASPRANTSPTFILNALNLSYGGDFRRLFFSELDSVTTIRARDRVTTVSRATISCQLPTVIAPTRVKGVERRALIVANFRPTRVTFVVKSLAGIQVVSFHKLAARDSGAKGKIVVAWEGARFSPKKKPRKPTARERTRLGKVPFRASGGSVRRRFRDAGEKRERAEEDVVYLSRFVSVRWRARARACPRVYPRCIMMGLRRP